ncbi:DASS family sodium-coupled anion symporter [Paenibacillus validus]|uniref:Sodium-dependent dicarboxylate transporter SdcS n=1 Tax=Paenibacillus validus TaxID=44253 RepID=A0A7X3CSS8_9BACL|nr:MULTISPECIES: DASS family sodium-coupled anion symporter [Paenibacillus]MED4600468.1 DASS family sodium-coupled anion symporter [Paenibacillus validus]MED4604727.1 DASS family sodium-coupled anion symporter [Paenibacillus validus]MUG71051.1 DASS family sodium-coupled anion symporter [Paenibacillus validus]
MGIVLNKKNVLLLCSFIFLIGAPMLPIPEAMGDKGWVALGILIFSIVLWGTQVIPAPITSFLAVALTAVFGIFSFEEAASELGNETIWLIISMLIMGAAVEKLSLDKRLTYSILSLAGGHVKWTLLCLFIVAFLLTFFIPNAVGRLALLLPIASETIHVMEKQGGRNVSTAIMLAITFVPYFSTIALLTGASGSIYAAGLFESMLGFRWSYLHWFIVMLPIVMIVLALLWVLLLVLFPAKVSVVAEGREYFQQQKKKLGAFSKQEYQMVFLYVLLILLWATRDLHHLSISLSAVLVMILLFLPGFRLIQWKDVVHKVDWQIPFLFAAGFTLANSLETSGFVAWISSWSMIYLDNLSVLSLVVAMTLIFVTIRFGFTNYTAMVASLMPMALSFAISTPYNPVWLGMICLVSSSIAFIFPTQSTGSLTTFSMGYYTSRDMLVSGSIFTLLIMVVTIVAAFYYWPHVGLHIYK